MDAMTIEQMAIVALCCAVAVPALIWAVWSLLGIVVEWAAPSKQVFQHRDHVAARKRAISHRGFKSRIGVR